MTTTMLEDGRRVQADECLKLEPAMYGPDDVPEIRSQHMWNPINLSRVPNRYAISCRCCDGHGSHAWAHPDGNPQDAGEYGCEACASLGEFKVVTP